MSLSSGRAFVVDYSQCSVVVTADIITLLLLLLLSLMLSSSSFVTNTICLSFSVGSRIHF